MNGAIVTVAGSRADAWEDPAFVRGLVFDWMARRHAIGLLISGGANGVDRWAEQAAIEYKIPREIIKPKWRNPDGSKNWNAGFERNSEMVDRAQYVVCWWAFHKGKWSGGTADTIVKSSDQGKLVRVYLADGSSMPLDKAVAQAQVIVDRRQKRFG